VTGRMVLAFIALGRSPSFHNPKSRLRTGAIPDGVAVADLEEAGGLLDPTTFRRVRYIVTENERVLPVGVP
jgi:hypothetical protein